jgi:hypothetical protein
MLITFSTAGVTSLHKQGRSPNGTCFTAWQQASDGGTFGPGIRTNWVHLDMRGGRVSWHEAATFWLPRIWIPTINNIAKAKTWRWVVVVAISFTRYGIYATDCSKQGLILNIACEMWHIWSKRRCYIDEGVVLALITSVLQFKVLMQETKKKRN